LFCKLVVESAEQVMRTLFYRLSFQILDSHAHLHLLRMLCVLDGRGLTEQIDATSSFVPGIVLSTGLGAVHNEE
jgi:hypothetical protein